MKPDEKSWSGRADSNRGPLAPKASALPGCATPRKGWLNSAERAASMHGRQLLGGDIGFILPSFPATVQPESNCGWPTPAYLLQRYRKLMQTGCGSACGLVSAWDFKS